MYSNYLKKVAQYLATVALLFVAHGIMAQSYFQITTSADNTSAHITTIDSGYTNGKSNDIVVVTPVYGQYVNAAVGLWYNGGKWKIYTEDRSKMPIGTKFNVMVMPAGAAAKRVTMPSGLSQDFIQVSGLSNSPVVIATHVYGNSGYNKSPVGFYKTGGRSILYNEDRSNIPAGMQFNVIDVSQLSQGSAFVHRNVGGNMAHVSPISNTKSTDKGKLLFSTVSLEVPGIYNRSHTGVWYSNNKWTVYNQDRKAMSNNVLFNVFLVDPTMFIYIPPDPIIILPPIDTSTDHAPTGTVRTKSNVLLPFNSRRSTIKYVEYKGKAIYQGDILLGNSSQVVNRRPAKHPVRPNFKAKYDNRNYGDISTQSSALTAVGTEFNEDWGECLWNFGVIPYVISGFNATDRATVESHVRYLDQNTNLTLKPRSGDSDYIIIKPNDPFPNAIGYSCVGRQGGSQEVVLGGTGRGHTVHEILHAAGFWHEQSRPDRDNFVEIVWANIADDDMKSNFDKHEDSRPLGPYDYQSVMHYGSTAFGDGNTTIRRASGSGPVGRGNSMTGMDKDGVNILYPIDAVTLVTPPLNSTRRIDVKIKRFEAKSGSDGCGEVEFFARMAIKEGHTWRAWNSSSGALTRQTSEVGGRLIAPSNWTHSSGVSVGATTAKVVIRMKESDGGFCFADDWVDINPLNGLMELQIRIDMVSGAMYIWDQVRNRDADYIGQVNTDIPLQGFETRDSDNDEAIPGHILFRIDVTNP